MNPHVDRSAEGSNVRMEAELIKWLGGFEPAGTPIALRFRTFADLRAEADRPRRRLPWLLPALSSMASLGAVVFGAGLIMLLAVAGASVSQGVGGSGGVGPSFVGGGAGSPPIDYVTSSYGPDPVALLLLLVASVLAGASVLLPRVQSLVCRIAFGKGEAAPSAPLPFRRPLRSISRLTWVLGAVAAVTLLGQFWIAYGVARMQMVLPEGLPSLFSAAMIVPFAVAVALRYPLRDRSSKLLLVGTVAMVANQLLFSTLALLSLVGLYPFDWTGLLYLVDFLSVASAVGIAAGLAGRSGSVRRPPLRLAAASVGVAFFIAATYLFLEGLGWNPTLPYPLDHGVSDLASWVVLSAWLAILWVGLSAWRQGRSSWRQGRSSWGWKLVVAAGALSLLAGLPIYLNQLYLYLNPTSFNAALDGTTQTEAFTYVVGLDYWWQMIATVVANAALLLALLIGLRPVPSDGVPPVAEPAAEEAPEVQIEGDRDDDPIVAGPTGLEPPTGARAQSDR